MYDPRVPNTYDQLKRTEIAARVAAQTAVPAAPTKIVEDVHDNLPSVFTSSMPLTAEDMRRQRLSVSARLGVQVAADMHKEEHEAALRERREGGSSAASKAAAFLLSAGGNDAAPAGAGSLASHLVLQKSSLLGGTHAFVPAPVIKQAPKGKPSATVLLRNIASPADDFAALQTDIQSECARFGVVRAVRIATVQPEAGWHEGEGVRVLVRFDTVAAAFKACEGLDARVYNGSSVHVSFFPTAQFDKGEFGPAENEIRVAT